MAPALLSALKSASYLAHSDKPENTLDIAQAGTTAPWPAPTTRQHLTIDHAWQSELTAHCNYS